MGGEPGGGEEDHAEEGDEVDREEGVDRGRDAGDQAEAEEDAEGGEVTVPHRSCRARPGSIPGLVRVRTRPSTGS